MKLSIKFCRELQRTQYVSSTTAPLLKGDYCEYSENIQSIKRKNTAAYSNKNTLPESGVLMYPPVVPRTVANPELLKVFQEYQVYIVRVFEAYIYLSLIHI